jgi:hypothetical protein
MRDKIEAALGSLFLAGTLIWAAYSCFYAPSQRAKSDIYAGSAVRLHAQATLAFGDLDTRIEPREGANIRLYLSKSTFESMPFPDRESVVETLGRQWCDGVNGAFLPVFSIHDIRDGKELARYGCTWHHVREWWRRQASGPREDTVEKTAST